MPSFSDFIYRLSRELRKDVPAAKSLRRVVGEFDREFQAEFDREFQAEAEDQRVAKPAPLAKSKNPHADDDDIPF